MRGQEEDVCFLGNLIQLLSSPLNGGMGAARCLKPPQKTSLNVGCSSPTLWSASVTH